MFDDAGVVLLVFPKAKPAPPALADCPPKRPGEDAAGVVVPNRPPVAGALVAVLLDCAVELVPKVKDMIASVCRVCGMRVSCLCLWNAMMQIIGVWRLTIGQSSSDVSLARHC